VVKTLCRWLYQNGYIADNPVAKVSAPIRQKKLLPAISKEQLDVLLSHCHCQRDRAVLSFLWYSGVRVSECAGVKATDFTPIREF
jgi:integrase/recombinase XerC